MSLKQMTYDDWLSHYRQQNNFRQLFEDNERLEDRVLRGCYLSSSESAQRRAIDHIITEKLKA